MIGSIQDVERLKGIDTEEECKRIVKTKVLSIAGTEDNVIFPPGATLTFDRCIRQHEMLFIDGAGHYFADPKHLQMMVDKCVAFLS